MFYREFKKKRLLMSSLLLSQVLCADCTCYGRYPEASKEISSCEPSPCSIGNFVGGGDWLFMRPLTSEIPVARLVKKQETTPATPPNALLFLDVEEKCISTKFSSGFDVFAYYQSSTYCNYYSWDIGGNFLCHDFSTKDKISVSSPQFLIPSEGFIPNALANQFLDAKTQLEMDFMSLSGELGLKLFPSFPFSFRIFMGANYSRLKQSVHFSYEDLTVSLPQAFPTTTVLQISKFHGVGPRLGLSAKWDLFYGLNVFGDFAVNLLFSAKSGRFFQDTDLLPSVRLNTGILFQAHEHFCHSKEIIPNLDVKLGIGFQLPCFDWFSIGIEGGYRALHYFNALQFLQITTGHFNDQVSADFLESKMSIQDQNYGLAGWFLGGRFVF